MRIMLVNYISVETHHYDVYINVHIVEIFTTTRKIVINEKFVAWNQMHSSIMLINCNLVYDVFINGHTAKIL